MFKSPWKTWFVKVIHFPAGRINHTAVLFIQVPRRIMTVKALHQTGSPGSVQIGKRRIISAFCIRGWKLIVCTHSVFNWLHTEHKNNLSYNTSKNQWTHAHTHTHRLWLAGSYQSALLLRFIICISLFFSARQLITGPLSNENPGRRNYKSPPTYTIANQR